MNALSKMILIVASFSIPIIAMEQQILPTLENRLLSFYEQTHEILNCSKTATLFADETNTKTKIAPKLIKLLEQLHQCKKDHNITEKDIALFAYTKTPSFLEKLDFIYPQATASHIAVFFKRLEDYNHHLSKSESISPTFEQYKTHLINNAVESNYKHAINRASSFGIFLSENSIKKDQPPFINIPLNINTHAFDTLISDIQKMQSEDETIIKALAELLYLNNKTAAEPKNDTNIENK